VDIIFFGRRKSHEMGMHIYIITDVRNSLPTSRMMIYQFLFIGSNRVRLVG